MLSATTGTFLGRRPYAHSWDLGQMDVWRTIFRRIIESVRKDVECVFGIPKGRWASSGYYSAIIFGKEPEQA